MPWQDATVNLESLTKPFVQLFQGGTSLAGPISTHYEALYLTMGSASAGLLCRKQVLKDTGS